jgi:hypothetical protein
MSTNKAIITFESPDVMASKPWPIGIDVNDNVTSGLGKDDGARLIGFGELGKQYVSVLIEDARDNPESVKGLVPTFAKDGGLFEWSIPVAEFTLTEPIVDKHFRIDIQMSNSAVQYGVDIAEILTRIARDVEQQDEGRVIRDINGQKVGTWEYVEVERS